MSSIFFSHRRSVRQTMIPSIRRPLQLHAILIEIGIPTFVASRRYPFEIH